MILLALIFLIFPPARAQMIAAPFWQARQTLNFTTTSQTIFNLNCSGITTIQNRRSNVAVNVSSNVVIDLAATDTTFYSDADCANPITSITMASGTSSVSFYFISATTGAKTVSATAPRYIPATQSQTVNTNGFIWIGGAGCDGNWATGACWSGGVAPSAASQIVIDGSCTLNCSPTISANISIAKVRLTNSCSSTITQANGVSITVTGWYQDCGTFVGGNAASPVTINGNYSLVGGNYTATAGTWTVTEDFVVQNTPVFSANAGLLTLSNGATTNSLTPGAVTYNNVKFNSSSGSSVYTISGTMTVAGTLTLASTNSGVGTLSGGTIVARGDVIVTNYGCNGGTIIQVTGATTGTSNIDGSAATSANLPTLEIVAGVNTVNLVGTLNLRGAYTYTSGTVSAGTSTLVLNAATGTITPGTVAYNNVTFSGASGTVTVVGTMTVGGNLTLSRSAGTRAIDGGTLDVLGNVIATTPSTGTTNIKMSGGTAATITGGNFTICGTSFEVDKAGSSVSLLTSALNYDSVGQTFTLTAGSMDMAGLAMTVKALSLNGTTLTKSAGVLTVNSIAQGTGALFGGIVNP